MLSYLASQITSDETGSEKWIHLTFTWAGKTFTLDIAESDRVFDLKAALQSLTDVPPERQKILGLVKGKLPPEQERVYVHYFIHVIYWHLQKICFHSADLKLVAGKKFTLIGTPQGNEIKDPSRPYSYTPLI